MTVKKAVTVGVWMVSLGLAINLLRELSVGASSVLGSPSPVVVAASGAPASEVMTPYTVIYDLSNQGRTTEGRTMAPGSAVKVMALRSDGSFAQQLESFKGRTPVSSRLVQLSSGAIVTTDDILGHKFTKSADINILQKLRDPSSRCLKTFAGTPGLTGQSLDGEEVIAGHATVRIKAPNITFWFAPALGCAELRSRFNHPSAGIIDSTATSIAKGEPSEALFDVASLVEVPRERLHSR